MGENLAIAVVFGIGVFCVVLFAALGAGLFDVEGKNDLETVRRRD